MGSNKRVDFPAKVKVAVSEAASFICSMEGCYKYCKSSLLNIGRIAHILPASPNGPRGNGKKVDSHIIRSAKNAIYLCETCHYRVDNSKAPYPELALRKLKLIREFGQNLLLQKPRLSKIDVRSIHCLSKPISIEIENFQSIDEAEKHLSNKFIQDKLEQLIIDEHNNLQLNTLLSQPNAINVWVEKIFNESISKAINSTLTNNKTLERVLHNNENSEVSANYKYKDWEKDLAPHLEGVGCYISDSAELLIHKKSNTECFNLPIPTNILQFIEGEMIFYGSNFFEEFISFILVEEISESNGNIIAKYNFKSIDQRTRFQKVGIEKTYFYYTEDTLKEIEDLIYLLKANPKISINILDHSNKKINSVPIPVKISFTDDDIDRIRTQINLLYISHKIINEFGFAISPSSFVDLNLIPPTEIFDLCTRYANELKKNSQMDLTTIMMLADDKDLKYTDEKTNVLVEKISVTSLCKGQNIDDEVEIKTIKLSKAEV